MAVETEEQREARLQRIRTNQSNGLAAETEEQREARLQRMRANQSDRLLTSITTAASVGQLLFYPVFHLRLPMFCNIACEAQARPTPCPA